MEGREEGSTNIHVKNNDTETAELRHSNTHSRCRFKHDSSTCHGLIQLTWAVASIRVDHFVEHR